MSVNGSEQLTKKDVERIRAEIEYRKTGLRPQKLAALKAAKAQGDLSENYEYTIAKRENNQNNSRIRYLEKMLERAIIVEETDTLDVVGINNTVTVFYDDDGEENVYRIVTPIRCNSLKGLISNESPLGRALLGRRKGEKVKVALDDGSFFSVTIVDIKKTGESDDDAIHQY